MANYTYTCLECKGDRRVSHGMTETVLVSCDCGGIMRRKIGRVNFQFARPSESPHYEDYREDLARFKGDPEARVNSAEQVKRLREKRLRQGWVEGPPLSECQAGAKDDDPCTLPMEKISMEDCYQTAKAKGFRFDHEL